MALGVDSLDLPRAFGPYTLQRRLAVGGMAEVYVAKARGLGGFEKLVAIKVIHPRLAEDEHFIHMLVEEAKISVLLTHMNIGQIFDLANIEDTYCIVMEYIEGADCYRLLRRAADRKIKLPLDLCAFITAEVCTGLDYAHRKHDAEGRPLGIVHRDISPQNVLVSWAGEVKIVDFGIAKAALRSGQTEAGVIKGKYYYMSPEQAWANPMDHRSDIFSTGVVLYELLTGEMLYREDNMPLLLERVRRAEITPPSRRRPEIPPELDAIVMRALAREPADRYASAHDLAEALTGFLYDVSPSFGSSRLSELMLQLFADEARRRDSSQAPPPPQPERRKAPRPAPDPPAGVPVMAKEEFAPNHTKSVILDMREGEAGTQRKASSERRTARSARPAARGAREPTRPIHGGAAQTGAKTRPVVAPEPKEEEEPTLIHSAAHAPAPSWEDDSTVVEDDEGTASGAEDDPWGDDATRVDNPAGASVGAGRPSPREALPAARPPSVSGIRASKPRGKKLPPAPVAQAAPRPAERRRLPGAPPPAPVPRPRARPQPSPAHRHWPGSQGPGPAAKGAPPSASAGRSGPPAAAPPPARSPRADPWPGSARGKPAPSRGPAVWPPTVPPAAVPPAAGPPAAGPPVAGSSFGAPAGAPRRFPGPTPHGMSQRAIETDRLSAMRFRPTRRHLLLLAGAAAVVTLIAIVVGALARPAPPNPVVEVISVPPGASVLLDGAPVPGTTPLRISDGLVLGAPHRIDVRLTGYEPWTTAVQVSQGTIKQIAVLTPIRASLHIDTDPTGATVFIDGVLHGKAPLEVPGLVVGQALSIRASMAGRADATTHLQIAPDDMHPRVRLSLPPSR